ncbi:nudix hydrolase 3 isoform X1 [Gossypium australe]|uniref:Nudix hydrolase 3 isoform X1 n=1 Tax=Gossypium australe TaxID=47621 RepID=A0A5B6WA30_9ROSI|nr:nudix hydrolase 3 isoform X1 [Gossypium australe]
MAVPYIEEAEYLDVLTKTGTPNFFGTQSGLELKVFKGDVHRDGDYHKAVHVWIFAESTQELLLQKRADCKDSWPGLWDISSAGHISAGDSSLITAQRELQEELGVILPKDAFELIFVFLEEWLVDKIIFFVTNNGKFINNEYSDVYLVTTLEPIPREAFTLQDTEVSDVKYISSEEYRSHLAEADPKYVPYDVNKQYGLLFDIITKRYKENNEARSLVLQKQLRRYAPVSLTAELTGLGDADKEALILLVKAAMIMDEIFYLQVWHSNPVLREWLKEHANVSQLDNLKWMSCLDENEAFLTTADSAVKLLPEATKPITGWKGVQYRAAFPMLKPSGANFYPPDMDKMEFKLWTTGLSLDQQKDATSFFTVIKRHSQVNWDNHIFDSTHLSEGSTHDLYSIPYSQEYHSFLARVSDLLHKAGDLVSSPSLKRLLHSKADAFLSNDYYDSDIAWMELDSKLDVTIGPYETYEDSLFGYKATFEAFIGVRDEKATAQLKLFGDNLQVLEQNLPMDDTYKSKDIIAAPIRVVQLLFNAGDVKGPQTIAFNLPNDERIVKDRGTAMVILKNVSEAKFKQILNPIADACIAKEQQELVDFESFFTHTICHECCHGIGPHTITLPDGRKSTVRLHLLPTSLEKSMYVSFLAGCFRSVRFGLEEAHGKGQALQFNWLLEKEAFVFHPNETFSVNFDKVEEAVESLSRTILTIQAKGDKEGASLLLQKYCTMTKPLKVALQKLESIHVSPPATFKYTFIDKILALGLPTILFQNLIYIIFLG